MGSRTGAETATQNLGGSCKAKSGQRAIARCDLGGVAPCGGIAHAPPPNNVLGFCGYLISILMQCQVSSIAQLRARMPISQN